MRIDTIDPAYYTVADAVGKRKRHAKHASMWLASDDLSRSAAHPFYARLNQILDKHDFAGYVERLCPRFYAHDGRPGLAPGRYFRLLLSDSRFGTTNFEINSSAYSATICAARSGQSPRAPRSSPCPKTMRSAAARS